MSLEEWVISGIAGAILAIISGVVKYWVGKVKEHAKEISTLKTEMKLNKQADDQYRKDLDKTIELKILQHINKQ